MNYEDDWARHSGWSSVSDKSCIFGTTDLSIQVCPVCGASLTEVPYYRGTVTSRYTENLGTSYSGNKRITHTKTTTSYEGVAEHTGKMCESCYLRKQTRNLTLLIVAGAFGALLLLISVLYMIFTKITEGPVVVVALVGLAIVIITLANHETFNGVYYSAIKNRKPGFEKILLEVFYYQTAYRTHMNEGAISPYDYERMMRDRFSSGIF